MKKISNFYVMRLDCCIMGVRIGISMAVAKTLKIGTLSPLTGPYAQDGTDINQGVMTAVAVFGTVEGLIRLKLCPAIPPVTAARQPWRPTS